MEKEHRKRSYLRVIMATLAILLVVLVFFLVWQSLALRRAQILGARELWISNVLKKHGPPTPSEVVFLRPWMTFDYVNKLFNVPPAYLKNTVPVNDARYPQITISSYAQENNMDVNTFLGSVEGDLRTYLMSVSTSTMASSTIATSTTHGI